ncbi:MAG: glucosyl-3-phosphoglycerate synthase [Actinomycetota bacterium]|nr:glucosyl-3-phosphoglycerate synthase [Actinomycetota bacterium]
MALVMGPPRFSGNEFNPSTLVEAKAGRFVSVCLPARDEAATVGTVVSRIGEVATRWPLVDEILVVDDGSADGTADVARAAGALVVRRADVLPGCGPGAGKGEALWKALAAAKGDLLVFCDADIRDFDPGFVTGLLGPLLLDEQIGFVKGRYERPGDGGRVTELVARPLLSLLFPHLAAFDQPLAGEFAGRREVLERLPFVEGYGVDLALLIDVVADLGLDRVAQVDLGVRVHRNRPLAELRPQAQAVLHAALCRAGVQLPAPVIERPPIHTVPEYRPRP